MYLNHITEAAMSYLARLYFYLTMMATILLAISQSDSNASSGPSAKATYEQFIEVKESCSLSQVSSSNHQTRPKMQGYNKLNEVHWILQKFDGF